MERLLRAIKAVLPRWLFSAAQPAYHYLLAGLGALWYRFPSRRLYVVGVTGTKGKTSTTELVAALLEAAGERVALVNTNRFRIGDSSGRNLLGRSMPGRMFLQRFLRRAVDAGCTYAVLEMTSEGARQSRHAFIDLDALIFTNLSPEHIESHGSYEKYVEAKVSLARALEGKNAAAHTIVANRDDAEAHRFLAVAVGAKLSFSLAEAEPYETRSDGSRFTWRGKSIRFKLPGVFNIANALAAATFAESRSIGADVIKKALEEFTLVPGRMEKVDEGQDFTVIVDYAHTADSLDQAYRVYAGVKKICVLGGTGGGRDKAKRKPMGEVVDRHCARVILTTEDAYDEDPREIADAIAEGIRTRPHEFILDRREAIRKAFTTAEPGSAVFITGKGAEVHLKGPKGALIPWDDAAVAREELKRLLERQ